MNLGHKPSCKIKNLEHVYAAIKKKNNKNETKIKHLDHVKYNPWKRKNKFKKDLVKRMFSF